MARIALTDGTGKWFDVDKAQKFKDAEDWDGNNNISMSAGEYCHHMLYRTASGRWILDRWSQWQGDNETYTEITDQEAAEWFMKNEYEDSDIPDDLLTLLADDIKELEV